MTQPSFFDDNTNRERFLKFHRDNPQVYEKLVEMANELQREFGLEKMSIKLLWERLRWLNFIAVLRNPENDIYKLNNNYHSRYARLIMQREPNLAEFFRTRELRKA